MLKSEEARRPSFHAPTKTAINPLISFARKATFEGKSPPACGVARDPDLEGVHPGTPLLPDANSPIVREREGLATASWPFLLAALGLAAAITVLGLLDVGRPAEPAEEQWAQTLGWGALDVQTARGVAAVAAGATVFAVAVVGWRFGHSATVGLLAAGLVALDPGFLLSARLGLPDTLAAAGLLCGLMGFLSPRPTSHWLATVALTVGAAANPAVLLWGLPLAALLVLRGHIYAAPRHLGLALLQSTVAPALGALLHGLVQGTSVSSCLQASRIDLVLLRVSLQPGPDTVFLHGPVTWLAGAGILLLVGGGAIVQSLMRFRVARAPGRFQARLTAPFHPFLGRGLWLLVLAVTAPLPTAWLALFALILALGTRELADDAPVFGVAIGVALLAFAALVLAGSWTAIAGGYGPAAVEQALDWIPWTNASGCNA